MIEHKWISWFENKSPSEQMKEALKAHGREQTQRNGEPLKVEHQKGDQIKEEQTQEDPTFVKHVDNG